MDRQVSFCPTFHSSASEQSKTQVLIKNTYTSDNQWLLHFYLKLKFSSHSQSYPSIRPNEFFYPPKVILPYPQTTTIATPERLVPQIPKQDAPQQTNLLPIPRFSKLSPKTSSFTIFICQKKRKTRTSVQTTSAKAGNHHANPKQKTHSTYPLFHPFSLSLHADT